LQCVAVCCSVLQCFAVCCSVLQCVAVCVELNQYMEEAHKSMDSLQKEWSHFEMPA